MVASGYGCGAVARHRVLLALQSHSHRGSIGYPAIDPWIITILIPVIIIPEFMHLVSAEIGAKDRLPRGFVASIIGLALIAMYVGARADLHSIAIAQLRNRTYVNEAPRKVGAYSRTNIPG